MSAFEQIIYRAPSGPNGMISQAAASVTDPGARERWLRQLDPWLRAGGPPGRAFLRFGPESVLIRWHDDSGSGLPWQFAHVVAGRSDQLTSVYALLVRDLPAKLPALPQDGRPLPVVDTEQVQLAPRADIDSRSRSRSAIELLVPLLSGVLAGARSIALPWGEEAVPEAVVWGLMSILEMLGDSRPVSFVTRQAGALPGNPGTLVSFRPGSALSSPVSQFETVAIGLAGGYADNPAGLRLTLRQHGISYQSDQAQRTQRLLELWPAPLAAGSPVTTSPTLDANSRSAQAVNTTPNGRPVTLVTCPICLTPIKDWDALQRWTWDKGRQSYKELTLALDLSGPERSYEERNSVKRCPNPRRYKPVEHYLPADYGSFGEPVVLGFIGLTRAGKTHLLASMVGAMQSELRRYRIDCRALDLALHRRFAEERVRRLLQGHEVLPGTQEGIMTFSDAFLVSQKNGAERPVILFDVAGGDLMSVEETKKFLEIANGLFFVVDPTQIDPRTGSDETFENVLDLLKSARRLPSRVSAAVVVAKADLLRFEDPVTEWLLADSTTLDADEFLRESRDVYAFLHERGATAWTLPYDECSKATLHFVSSTGGDGLGEGGVYPRGVSPRRVLRPMLAMLAMTGVLTGTEAGKVGI